MSSNFQFNPASLKAVLIFATALILVFEFFK